jgi:hypothetical protein
MIATMTSNLARSTRRSIIGAAAVAALALVGAAACTTPTDPPGSAVVLPPANAGFDYQIGATYTPPAGVSVVSRDREASPAPGLYNICYVNGFQAQTEDESWWLANHRDLVLSDSAGRPVKDSDWNELILDVSTAAKREGLGAIVGGWIAGCRSAGFQAVEIDNLDSYSRSGGRLTQAQAVSFMRVLTDRAHGLGLAVAQKNSSEITGRRAEMGTDFAVVEECNRYTECDTFTGAYGNEVFIVEYRQADFAKGCRDWPQLSIVLRDVAVQTRTTPDHIC